MKLLFLDVDGVLNSHQQLRSEFRFAETRPRSGRNMPFCQISCSNLLEVLARSPDTMIVVSSSWRIGRTLDQLKEDLAPSQLPMDRIIGMTPSKRRNEEERGHEIQAFLDAYQRDNHLMPERIVIIDDNSDMAHLEDRLVQTDTRMGFMWDKAVETMVKLGLSIKDIYGSEAGFL